MTEHWPDKPKRKPKLKRKRKLKDRPGWHWWLLPLLFLLLILLVGVSLFVTVERESGEESGEIEPVTVGDCAPPETPLVFRRYVDQQVDLYVMGGPDSQPRQLTDSENLEHFADWSPDGQYIAFRTNEALVLIDADGTNQRVLFEKPAEAEFNTIWWSPDSHYVGFVVGNSIAQWWKLYTVHSASGTVTELDTHTYTNPIWWWWSPDGSRIVYAAQQDGITGVYAIAPDSAPDGDQQITFNADTGEEPRANWSPDGQMVAYYNANARQIEIVAAGSGDMLHRIDGGWNIFGSGGPHRPWSPDDTRLAYNLNGEIAVYDLLTGTSRVITANNAQDYYFAWPPGDSSRVLFSAPVDDLPGLYVADLESGQTTRLYDSQVTYAEWSPDGSRVFFSVLMQNDDSTWFEEWLVNADGQTPAHVLSRDAIWNYNRAAWSPDGSLLAYWGNSGLFLYDVQAGESCRLIDGTDFDWQGAR